MDDITPGRSHAGWANRTVEIDHSPPRPPAPKPDPFQRGFQKMADYLQAPDRARMETLERLRAATEWLNVQRRLEEEKAVEGMETALALSRPPDWTAPPEMTPIPNPRPTQRLGQAPVRAPKAPAKTAKKTSNAPAKPSPKRAPSTAAAKAKTAPAAKTSATNASPRAMADKPGKSSKSARTA